MQEWIPGALRNASKRLERARMRKGSPAELALLTTFAAGMALVVDVGGFQRWVLVIPLLPYLLADLAAGQRWRGASHLAAWAGTVVALGLITGVHGTPPDLIRVQAAVQHEDAVAFLDEGEGLLARPEDFATDHVLDYVYVTVGSAFTGGLSPVLMGVRQLLLGGWEWGALVRERGAGLLGLPLWTPVGAVGYATLLLGWGEVTGAYLAQRRIQWTPLRNWVAVGTILLVLHLVMRIGLAYSWLRWLR